eukprot:TRINITY_DN95447_c0_g1_i1.p1 TRINITY_DN95447_c0_g1~~TRINITY_DN95447_c0_g1_i1.p1  ORF type:complete len:194 (-),score=40.78 TRINITY_DN95447_c0_g1_i1:112-693(-)
MAGITTVGLKIWRSALSQHRLLVPLTFTTIRRSEFSAATGEGSSQTNVDRKDSTSSSNSNDKKQAAPYQGKHSIEGVLLPILDAEAVEDGESQATIEDRLQHRLKAKISSSSLSATASSADGASMFGHQPSDCAAPKRTAAYQVEGSTEHLDEMQTVLRKLRRTGRDETDKDVSDSMLKVMEYLKQKKVPGQK